jgi:hypothetical protein
MSEASLEDKVENVSVLDLKTYPGNPRVGDKEAIAESLKVNGQFSPLIVQRSTGYILSGNHTFMAARDILKWSTIRVVYVDADDTLARRIVTAANRIAEKGGYNEILLMEMLQTIADDDIGLEGTGYDDAYLDDLITRIAPDEEDEGYEIEEQPTEAAYAETPEKQAERTERIASNQPLGVQGLSEIVVVLPVEEKADLLSQLDALRQYMGDEPNGPLVHQAVRIALVVCEAAHMNAQPCEWSDIITRADAFGQGD